MTNQTQNKRNSRKGSIEGSLLPIIVAVIIGGLTGIIRNTQYIERINDFGKKHPAVLRYQATSIEYENELTNQRKIIEQHRKNLLEQYDRNLLETPGYKILDKKALVESEQRMLSLNQQLISLGQNSDVAAYTNALAQQNKPLLRPFMRLPKLE